MSDTSVEITNESAFQEGSLGIQVVLAIVTLGLYTIYWWYQANTQVAEGTNAGLDPTIQTVLFIIPIVNFYAVWQFANAVDSIIDQDSLILFILFIVFAPAFWFLIQSGFNGIASA